MCPVMSVLTAMIYRGCGRLPIGPIGPSQELIVSFTLSTELSFSSASSRLEADYRCAAVHILALLFHPHKPVSTIIIEQYRPPVASTVIGKSIYLISHACHYSTVLTCHAVELPAGLIDEGEDPATTALRELHEETGYGSGKSGQGNVTVTHVSHVLAKDPG